jgi:phage tail-like protein
LVLTRDGVLTPPLAALHLEGPRFSWPERWLPEHWRETRFGPDADVTGPASGPDFLERLLANAEGVLTGIEQRIAQAHLLHDPQAAPPGWLDWLGGWLGLTLDPGLAVRRRRACIANAMRIFRFRGTLGGLALALDCASGGAVTRGELVIVEDFRLRRTFATILGADLVDEDDPLLPGLIESGNSIVGDTLFVGQDAPDLQRELLALFGADRLTTVERATVRAFYDRLAQRITVLAHRDLPEDELRLVRSVIERETPAHLGRRVLSASDGLLVGVSSLVDVDTFLRDRDPPQPVAVDVTTVGTDGYVFDLPALDPRLDA